MTGIGPTLAGHIQHFGYWTVATALLLENAGVPVPGETILLLASALASMDGGLRLPTVILVATAAATAGDNLGYIVGHWGGRPLLDRYRRIFRVSPEALGRGERLFDCYGAVAVFLARFIFGLRIIAGPLAGVLRMSWRRFAVWNALGAITWVSTMSCLGYLFGRRVPALLGSMRTANLVLLAVVVVLVAAFWKRLIRSIAARG